MLSVYTRHHPDCAKKDDSNYRRCRCPKWLDGTLPGRSGRFRVSAKTKSWEQAELLARKYERSALAGEDVKIAKTLPTVKERSPPGSPPMLLSCPRQRFHPSQRSSRGSQRCHRPLGA